MKEDRFFYTNLQILLQNPKRNAYNIQKNLQKVASCKQRNWRYWSDFPRARFSTISMTLDDTSNV